MKVTDIFNLTEGLLELSDKELPIATALKVQSNHQKASDALKSPIEVRKKLINKYKESEETDGSVKLKPELAYKYHEENQELMAQEVEIDFQKITISEIQGISIKPRILALLKDIINYEEDKIVEEK